MRCDRVYRTVWIALAILAVGVSVAQAGGGPGTNYIWDNATQSDTANWNLAGNWLTGYYPGQTGHALNNADIYDCYSDAEVDTNFTTTVDLHKTDAINPTGQWRFGGYQVNSHLATTFGVTAVAGSAQYIDTSTGDVSFTFFDDVGLADVVTISAPIKNGGGISLNSGSGGQSSTLYLTNTNNNYTGLTTITGETLAYGASNVIYTGGVMVSGGTLNLVTYSDSVGAVTLTSGSILGGAASTLTSTVGFAVQSGSASAILAGTGIAMTKTTTGAVTLTGANTYTGLTTVNGGTLELGAAARNPVLTLSPGGANVELGKLVFDYSGAAPNVARWWPPATMAGCGPADGSNARPRIACMAWAGTMTAARLP